MGCDAYKLTVLTVKRQDKPDDWIEIDKERLYFSGSYDSDDEDGYERAFQAWIDSEDQPDKTLFENGKWISDFVEAKYKRHISSMEGVTKVVKLVYREPR